jgi:hypothetical protein
MAKCHSKCISNAETWKRLGANRGNSLFLPWFICPALGFSFIPGTDLIPLDMSSLKFFEFVKLHHEEKGTALQSMDRQRQLLEAAGFIDIQVFEKYIDCGCYTEGGAEIR